MRHLRHVFLILAVMVGGSLGAQNGQKDLEQLMRSRGEYFFTLTVQQPTEIQVLSDLCSVASIDGKTIVCYASQSQYDNLLKRGYHPLLQTPPSLLETHVMWDGSDRTHYDWDQYPTYEAYESMMQAFATEHPERCTYFELGTLASGRKLMFCRINNGQPEGKPKFLYTSTIHGDETTGFMLMLRLIDELCTSNDSRIVNLVNNLDIYICPNTNPDGTYYGGNNTVSGARRRNANDVDLNRHYPDMVSGAHPDGEICYQDETQWLMNLAQDNPFTMAANYHGGAEVMNYPWDNYTLPTADDAWWEMVCRQYADLVHQHNPNYMTDYNNGIVRGCVWYMISGGRQDYMNYYNQCREVTIECSRSYVPPASQMPMFWNYNHNSMLSYMEQCLNGIHGTITDAVTGEPIVATVSIEKLDDMNSEVSSHLPAGDYHRLIKGGTYDLTYAAYGYEPQTITITVNDNEAVTQNVQLVPDGSPLVADFDNSEHLIPTDAVVRFADLSKGASIVQWNWEFPGGTPSVSTELNPYVTYQTPGTYDVTLTITNSNGESATLTRPNLIQVCEPYFMGNGKVTTCDKLFYPSGGLCGNYASNENYTTTFMPAEPNRKIRVNFLGFKTEAGYDFLTIYDGTSTNAPKIGSYSGTQNPGCVTATNPQGALTFHFASDNYTEYTGWKAHVTCLHDESVDENGEARAKVYPNPNQGSFTIETEEPVQYALYNSLGQCVLSSRCHGKTQIEAQQLRQGVYFLHLNHAHESSVEKMVIEK